MITDEQAKAIREEEELRYVVRREIETRFAEPQTRLTRVFTFLNTSVGAFLLSTVLIGMITYFHSELSVTLTRRAERADRLRKVGLEVANRLQEISRMEKRFDGHYRAVVRTAFDGFRSGDTQNESYKLYYAAMFPELRERTLKSLVYELIDLSDKKEATQFRALLPTVQGLRDFYDRLQYDEIPPGPHTPNHEPIELFYLDGKDTAAFKKALVALKSLGTTG